VGQEVEHQLQQEYESSREQIGSLEDQLQAEKRRRDDAEIEVSKQKQVTCTCNCTCIMMTNGNRLFVPVLL